MRRESTGNTTIEFPHELHGLFTTVTDNSAMRERLEERIRSGFGSHFGACIHGFMRDLTVYEHRSGATGVIGIRAAGDEPLLLENYLDEPVEAIVSRLAGQIIPRCRIAEVGQFVIDNSEAVRDFFTDLIPFLRHLGFEWICFTGTGRIRAILARLGLQGLPLVPAREERVSHLGDSWGSYYDNDPVVTIGSLVDPAGNWLRTAPIPVDDPRHHVG